MAKGIAVLIIVILGLAGALGFHWVSYPGSRASVLCVLPKDQLSFNDTLVSGDTQLSFTLQHPILATQIVGGRGWCTHR